MQQVYIFKDYNSDNTEYKIFGIGHEIWTHDYYVTRLDYEMYSLEFIAQGNGWIDLNGVYSDQKSGDVIILHKHSKHTYALAKNSSQEKIWIMIDGQLISNFVASFNIGKNFIFKAPECADNFYRIAEYSRLYESNYHELKRRVIVEIADIFSKLSCDVPETEEYSLAHKIMMLLDKQVYKKYNLDSLAKSLNYSKNYIISTFKREFNDTPFNCLINLKIDSAKQYLAHSLLSVNDISEKLQFSHCSYFCDIFKRKVGASPSEYRKKNFKNKQL